MRVKLVIVHCKQSKCQMVPRLQVLAGDDTRVLTSSVSTLLTMGALTTGHQWCQVLQVSWTLWARSCLLALVWVGRDDQCSLRALSQGITVTTLYLAITNGRMNSYCCHLKGPTHPSSLVWVTSIFRALAAAVWDIFGFWYLRDKSIYGKKKLVLIQNHCWTT